MEAGTLGDELNPWSLKMFQTLRTVDPETPTEQAAYAKYLDERSDREAARDDRIHGAVGVIPDPLWIVLLFSAFVIFVFMLFFADSGERAVVQAMLMGSVTAVIVSMLLLLQFLDSPFHEGVGGLRPVAMERTLMIIDQQMTATGLKIEPPCDERSHHRAPPRVHRHRISLQFGGLQDDPHPLAVSKGLGFVKGVERQQRRPQRVPDGHTRVEVGQLIAHAVEVGVEIAPG
jgi:hypothetical protein